MPRKFFWGYVTQRHALWAWVSHYGGVHIRNHICFFNCNVNEDVKWDWTKKSKLGITPCSEYSKCGVERADQSQFWWHPAGPWGSRKSKDECDWLLDVVWRWWGILEGFRAKYMEDQRLAAWWRGLHMLLSLNVFYVIRWRLGSWLSEASKIYVHIFYRALYSGNYGKMLCYNRYTSKHVLTDCWPYMGIPSLGWNDLSIRPRQMPILGAEDGGQEVFKENGQSRDGSGFLSFP